MREYEYCRGCNNRVPDTEDSLYAGSRGPFCDRCYVELPDKLAEECDMKHNRIKDLIAENKRLKAELAAERERVERLREAVPALMKRYSEYVPPEDGSAGDYYVEGWNDCRQEVLQAFELADTQKLTLDNHTRMAFGEEDA